MFRRISQSRVVKNITVLASGHAIAQAIALAASPILTRLYDPAAFGTLGLVVSVASAIITVSALRYEMAIVTARDDTTASNLLALCCAIVLLSFGISAGIVASFGDWIAAQFQDQGTDLAAHLWWIPVLILVAGMALGFSHWFVRKALYKRLATIRASQQIAVVLSQIAAGLLGLGASGLLGGRVAGSVIATTILAVFSWRRIPAVPKSEIKLDRIWRVAKENSQFPKYNAPQNLISSISRVALPFTLGLFFGVETVGLYWLADRVLRAPASLVERSVRTVFYQRSSELFNKGKTFYPLLLWASSGLMVIGLVPLTILLLFGPEIFSIVFGAEWRKAGIMTQWLSAWWLVSFVSGPAVESLTVLRLQKYSFFFQIVLSSARIIAVVLGAMMGDDITAIAAASVVGVVFNFALLVAVIVTVRNKSMTAVPAASE